jgi:hypothetical protein
MKKVTIMIAAAFLLLATSAFADVTFDPSNGTGFVGKGNVQLAFNWNNATLQSNAQAVTFTYIVTDTYNATAQWTTGDGTPGYATHSVTHTVSTGVNDTVVGTTRNNKLSDVTGFNLLGFGTTTTTGDVPVIGQPAPGFPGTDAVYTDVTKVSSVGGLYVNFVTLSVPIWSAQ